MKDPLFLPDSVEEEAAYSAAIQRETELALDLSAARAERDKYKKDCEWYRAEIEELKIERDMLKDNCERMKDEIEEVKTSAFLLPNNFQNDLKKALTEHWAINNPQLDSAEHPESYDGPEDRKREFLQAAGIWHFLFSGGAGPISTLVPARSAIGGQAARWFIDIDLNTLRKFGIIGLLADVEGDVPNADGEDMLGAGPGGSSGGWRAELALG
ncbi:hypothetical protein GALMADRAFT_216880 [Galerina marginata CBS 339.88]|uniref:Uncharacterized protein n=1 Tax=Galerina marginata (strain CBS 339.88) TaxID=685588 RepID=A0A067S783_GALM3|nr:hypothetical protein GALMADRAFT_216880 [Galerina marginata CBS 339.88]